MMVAPVLRFEQSRATGAWTRGHDSALLFDIIQEQRAYGLRSCWRTQVEPVEGGGIAARHAGPVGRIEGQGADVGHGVEHYRRLPARRVVAAQRHPLHAEIRD